MPIAITPIMRRLLPWWSILGISRDNSSGGRIWARITLDDEEYSLELFRREEMSPSQLVASATAEGPVLTLVEANDSGLSGTAEMAPDAEAVIGGSNNSMTGVIQCAPAFDADLVALEPDLTALLFDGEYADGPGFTVPIMAAAKYVNDVMSSRLLNKGWCDDEAQEAMALVQRPSQLSNAVIHLALSRIFQREAGRGDPRAGTRATHHSYQARLALGALRLLLTRADGRTSRLDLSSPTVRAW